MGPEELGVIKKQFRIKWWGFPEMHIKIIYKKYISNIRSHSRSQCDYYVKLISPYLTFLK